MSVIVSDSNNGSYDGNLSTASGWYRAEAYNLGSWGTPLTLGTTRNISVTFANAGNLQGVVIGLAYASYTGTVNKDVTVELVESGTTVRASKTLTSSEIRDGSDIYYGAWATPFKFATPYAVDTVGSKWTIRVSLGSGTSNWNAATSDGTNLFYVAWCDTAVTASSTNDALIIVDPITIESSFTTKAYAVTGDATRGVCGVICTTFDATAPYNLTWSNPPAATYTFTVDGQFCMSTHGGLQIGTTALPIPIAQYADVKFKRTVSVGTTVSGFVPFTTSVSGASRMSFDIHGEVATGIKTTLSANASTGQAKINVTDPTGFSATDIIVIGGEQSFGGGSAVQYTINSISGSEFTLNTNIVSFTRLAGGEVIKYTLAHGVRWQADSNSTVVITQFAYRPSNWTWKGVSFLQTIFSMASTQDPLGLEDAANYNAWEMTDCQVLLGGTSNIVGNFFLSSVAPPPKGFTLTRVYVYGPLISTVYKLVHIIGSSVYLGGPLTYSYVSSIKANTSSATPNLLYNLDPSILLTMDNCSASNGFVGLEMAGSGGAFTNIKVMCCQSGIDVANLFNPTNIDHIDIDYCTYGLIFGTSLRKGACVGFNIKDADFSETAANTTDLAFTPGSLIDGLLGTPINLNTIETTNIPALVVGSKLGMTNFDNTTNDDRNYLNYGYINRTGDSLSDTTVHTSGTGKFALRFESSSSTNLLDLDIITPTGDISGEDMVVACWVKLNSANYYSGTYQMPRLTVTYDQTSTVYAEAAAVTDWQMLLVPFSPTTTYGQITVTLSTMTDQTGSSAYVYFDDISVLYPAGYVLNLGGLDLWADALPVSPPISTSISALDVWAADPSVFGTGSIGKFVTKLLSVAKFLALK